MSKPRREYRLTISALYQQVSLDLTTEKGGCDIFDTVHDIKEIKGIFSHRIVLIIINDVGNDQCFFNKGAYQFFPLKLNEIYS